MTVGWTQTFRPRQGVGGGAAEAQSSPGALGRNHLAWGWGSEGPVESRTLEGNCFWLHPHLGDTSDPQSKTCVCLCD